MVIGKASEGPGLLSAPEDAEQFVDTAKIEVVAPEMGNIHGLLQTARIENPWTPDLLSACCGAPAS